MGLGRAPFEAHDLADLAREPDLAAHHHVVEDRALADVLGPGRPCSSIKGWIGHTLGAAGIMNALVACLCLEERFAPPGLQTRQVDPTFVGRVLLTEERRPLRTVLSNAFGFGGSNACLLLGWHP